MERETFKKHGASTVTSDCEIEILSAQSSDYRKL